jgi:hypothetical protein
MAKKRVASNQKFGDERLGIFDDHKTYNQHSVARILGLADPQAECSKFVLRKLLHAGLPFAKVGRQFLISGKLLREWVESNSKTWDEQMRK